MTQLLIADTEVVLPQNFSTTIKRENSFFTKSGEYSYDITLRLDNPVNLMLYGFLNRTNKSGQLDTDRTAVLTVDGRVYCRGREVITRWTEQSVSIQIVSGESELNYFIGQDRKVEELDLGEVKSDDECVWPVVRTAAKAYINVSRTWVRDSYLRGHYTHTWTHDVPSPYLYDLLERIIRALGYTIGTNQLTETDMKHLFLLNTVRTRQYARMVPGWTVSDLLQEVEKLTGVVFIIDNLKKTCDIILKTRFYLGARQLPLNDVVDAYEAEVTDGDGGDTDFTASNVSYDLPSHRWANLMRLPEGLPTLEKRGYNSLRELVRDAWAGIEGGDREAQEKKASEPVILVDNSTGRAFIRMFRMTEVQRTGYTFTLSEAHLAEVDQMADLKRDETASTMELKITPAPMVHFLQIGAGMELIDLCSEDGFFEFHDYGMTGEESEDGADEDQELNEGDGDSLIEDTIRQAEKKESSAGDLYCAFYHGDLWNGMPVVYTDSYHVAIAGILTGFNGSHSTYNPGQPEGSLRLKDLEDTYYQGGYEIDTRHAMTFETFDPNVIDPRQVYVIRNRRYVVRDVEETINAEGRVRLWKLTCYPIKISDEAIEKRWVLTKGVWDDGAAWLDDGRWNDSNPN